MDWINILNLAIEYIENNLNENITLGDVADSVHVSMYHFQRAFSIFTGFSVGEYIRNRRLSIAGQTLTYGGVRVLDVALECGYENAESFSRAFERFHGIKPSQAKKEGASLKSFNKMVIKVSIEGGSVINYRIEKKESFKVVLYPEIFEMETCVSEIPEKWSQYIKKEQSNIVCPEMGVRVFDQNRKDFFTYGIGCHMDLAKNVPEKFKIYEIPEYTWAIFSCIGPMPRSIQNMWKRIYSEWLPQSRYKFIEEYDIEYYTEGDIYSEGYESEIWIPISEK